jgi:hypothetical protein
MVRKNKTGLRASLTTDGSLSAILKVELNNPYLSHPFNPSSSLIEKSKKGTSVILIITRSQCC